MFVGVISEEQVLEERFCSCAVVANYNGHMSALANIQVHSPVHTHTHTHTHTTPSLHGQRSVRRSQNITFMHILGGGEKEKKGNRERKKKEEEDEEKENRQRIMKYAVT